MNRNLIALTGFAIVFGSSSLAQATTSVPADLNSAAVAGQINANIQAASPQKVGVKQAAFTCAKPPQFSSTGQGHFIVRSIYLSGGDAPIPACARSLLESVVGKSIDFQGLQALAGQLEDRYRESGYLLNQVIIPPQRINIKDGAVQFKAIDGHISRVELSGDSPQGAKKQLLRYLAGIQNMSAFDFKMAERYLLLANDIPGLQVKGNLRADPINPGASIMDVTVKRKAVQGVLNFNNRGSQNVGPKQLLAQVGVNDLFGADRFQLTAATTAPHASELSYLNANYAVQLGEKGTQISASFLKTRTAPNGSYGSLGLVGHLEQLMLGITQPILRSLNHNLSFVANLYHVQNKSSFNTGPSFNDLITGVQGGLNYNGLSWGGSNQLQSMLTQGIPFEGVHAKLPSRTSAVQEFTKFNLSGSHLRYLTQHTSLLFSANGQYSGDSLPVSEQLGYGGSSYGMAYQPSELTGDKGVMGSISLRYDLAPPSYLSQLQPFVSYDIGELWVNSPVAGQDIDTSGSSIGVGFNFVLKHGLQASIMLAAPLTKAPSANTDKDLKLFFNLSWSF